ncbi:PepSY domain-containing protein [Acinetobacter sp. MD2(2019)]|nr:PepSY domain-containing protein [Acinetobacter sp. MD2(2019)]
MDKKSARTPIFRQLLQMLHVQVGVLVAPFIFIAALTGLLYALTPQIENSIYQQQLFVDQVKKNAAQPLSAQIRAAQHFLPERAQIVAVRPAATLNATTRIIYLDVHQPEQTIALFVNPYTLAVQGRLPVYGTSGVLPMRTFLDNLHRNLLIGTYGRAYSELAASWLGVLALTGFLQLYRKRKKKTQHQSNVTSKQWHSWVGLAFFPMLIFFSATGLTWSNWAGANIAKFRHWANSDTPSLNTQLHTLAGQSSTLVDAHAEHHMHMQMAQQNLIDPNQFDVIQQLARRQGLNAAALQIKPNIEANQAWTVEEIQHKWPIKIDALAIDMQQLKVVDRLHFKDFPLSAKLTRWGVDAHIGVLFGWINQLILIFSATAILLLIALGYYSWLSRVEVKKTLQNAPRLWMSLWQKATALQCGIALVVLIALYFIVPVWVVSLVLLQFLCWIGTKLTRNQIS